MSNCCCPCNEQSVQSSSPGEAGVDGPGLPGLRDSPFGEVLTGIPESGLVPRNRCTELEEEYDEEINLGGVPPMSGGVPPPADLVQFSPAFSGPGIPSAGCVVTNTAASATPHDPDSITSIPSGDWTASQWDGVTTWNACTLTKEQLYAAIWPVNVKVMRGLRELFYSVNPFANNSSPTVAEIDEWNERVINHYRSLLGISNPISNDIGLYLRAQWATERKHTTYWNTSYPTGEICSPGGAHCGWTFIPSCSDQTPYLPSGVSCVTDGGQAEGIYSIETNLPWSIKLATLIARVVQTEGITGHGGPFVKSPLMGINWKCNGASTEVRIKSSGTDINPCL